VAAVLEQEASALQHVRHTPCHDLDARLLEQFSDRSARPLAEYLERHLLVRDELPVDAVHAE
jgi:hypothetical protein